MMNQFGMPQYGFGYGNIKTPEQIQQEFNLAMNQYRNGYNNMAPQPSFGQSNQSIGTFRPVKSYQEVENSQVSMDGTPTLFINEEGNTAWLKKWINGQAFISAYTYSMVNSTGSPEKNDVKNDHAEKKDDISAIKDILVSFDNRLKSLEGKATPVEDRQSESIKSGNSNQSSQNSGGNVFEGL